MLFEGEVNRLRAGLFKFGRDDVLALKGAE
jgi:hypothetical protein